jgi:hypothetical protein
MDDHDGLEVDMLSPLPQRVTLLAMLNARHGARQQDLARARGTDSSPTRSKSDWEVLPSMYQRCAQERRVQ